MKNVFLAGILAIITCSIPMHARCRNGHKVIWISAGTPTAGETVAGPCTIIVRGLNPARYDYAFSSAATFGAAPDLWSKLLGVSTGDNAKATPATPPAGAAAQPDHNAGAFRASVQAARPTNVHPNPSVARAADRLTQLIDAAEATMNDVDDSLSEGQNQLAAITAAGQPLDREVQRFNFYQDLRRKANAATSAVSLGGRALLLFLQQSDSDVVNGGYPLLTQDIATLLVQGVNPPPPPDSTFIAGTKAAWPDQAAISGIRLQLANDAPALQTAVQTLTTFKTNQELKLTGLRDTLVTLREEIKKELQSVSNVPAQQQGNSYINKIKFQLNLIDDQKNQMAAVLNDLNSAVKRDADTSSGLADIDFSGKPYADFSAAQGALLGWRDRLAKVVEIWNGRANNPDPFMKEFHASCEFAFSRTKTIAIQLVKTDKIPGSTSPTTTTPLLSVECTSPFTVSAGVAFSTIGEHEFAIQPAPVSPGSTTTQNTFVEVNDSGIHPLPLGMIHVRLHESNSRVSWHGSFGLAGNFRSQSAGGSNAEFLIGGSLALFRTVFLTPGLYIGQKTSLGAGFTLNSAVPASITQPPLQKSYKSAFGFAITFTKP
jgi:hypothetical protein